MKLSADEARNLVIAASEQALARESAALKAFLDSTEKAISAAALELKESIEIPCRGDIRALAIDALKQAGYEARSEDWSNVIFISWRKKS